MEDYIKEDKTQSLDINDILKEKNILDIISKKECLEIEADIINGYEIDLESSSDWRKKIEEAESVIKQTIEYKNTPFENASNLKFPLMTLATIDFASRQYTQLIQGNQVMKFAINGKEKTDSKYKRTDRLSRLHNYQLLLETDSWESDTDRMLHHLPIAGTTFKKVYFDEFNERPVSEFCSPKNIVVNMNTPSLENAVRISHVIELSNNDILQKIREGLFKDIEIEKLTEQNDNFDPNALHTFVEQHFEYDLDDDGYKEPYIGIVHLESGKLLGLYHRIESIHRNKDNEIIKIVPLEYFVDYHFIRFNEGEEGFYSTGYSTMMYALNQGINSIINNLIDAGTLNNMQSGYYNLNIRAKNKDLNVQPGEFKGVQTGPGTKLADNIYPLPTKEPSQTLFALLGFLVDIGKDLTSINDALQGKQAATHVSPTTMMSLVEQGLKVFNAIHKRLFNAFKKEFRLIYNLNKKYLSKEKYYEIIDDPEANKELDFRSKGYDVTPIMDSSMSSRTEKMIQAEALMADPLANPREARMMYYGAMGVSDTDLERLFPLPDPNAPPPPEEQKTMAEVYKTQTEAMLNEVKAQVEQLMLDIKASEIGIKNKELELKAQELKVKLENSVEDMALKVSKEVSDVKFKDAELRLKAVEQFLEEKKIQFQGMKTLSDMDKNE